MESAERQILCGFPYAKKNEIKRGEKDYIHQLPVCLVNHTKETAVAVLSAWKVVWEDYKDKQH